MWAERFSGDLELVPLGRMGCAQESRARPAGVINTGKQNHQEKVTGKGYREIIVTSSLPNGGYFEAKAKVLIELVENGNIDPSFIDSLDEQCRPSVIRFIELFATLFGASMSAHLATQYLWSLRGP